MLDQFSGRFGQSGAGPINVHHGFRSSNGLDRESSDGQFGAGFSGYLVSLQQD